jgi:hypothetical protein
MLAETESKPIAQDWVRSARAALARGPDDALTNAALRVNFAWDRVPARARSALLAFVDRHFASIEGVLKGSDALFVVADPEDWRPHFGDTPPPAYVYGGLVYFTSEFRPFDPATQRGFGPLCRAAMVVHESVHVFDARSGEAEIHVSEWDEPRFSLLVPELQRHNPSAYASFSAQVHHQELEWPRDARFGAGQPGV